MNHIVRIAAVLCVPAIAGSRPTACLDPDKTVPARTHYRTFPSKLAGGDVSYLVYLPPSCETEPVARFPAVYRLHGLKGDPHAGAKFVEQMDLAIRAGESPATMASLANGMSDSFYSDSPDGRWPVESIVVKELIPHVNKAYRPVGGYGAADLGFKYPGLFGIGAIDAGTFVGLSAQGRYREFESDSF